METIRNHEVVRTLDAHQGGEILMKMGRPMRRSGGVAVVKAITLARGLAGIFSPTWLRERRLRVGLDSVLDLITQSKPERAITREDLRAALLRDFPCTGTRREFEYRHSGAGSVSESVSGVRGERAGSREAWLGATGRSWRRGQVGARRREVLWEWRQSQGRLSHKATREELEDSTGSESDSELEEVREAAGKGWRKKEAERRMQRAHFRQICRALKKRRQKEGRGRRKEEKQ